MICPDMAQKWRCIAAMPFRHAGVRITPASPCCDRSPVCTLYMALCPASSALNGTNRGLGLAQDGAAARFASPRSPAGQPARGDFICCPRYHLHATLQQAVSVISKLPRPRTWVQPRCRTWLGPRICHCPSHRAVISNPPCKRPRLSADPRLRPSASRLAGCTAAQATTSLVLQVLLFVASEERPLRHSQRVQRVQRAHQLPKAHGTRVAARSMGASHDGSWAEQQRVKQNGCFDATAPWRGRRCGCKAGCCSSWPGCGCIFHAR